MSKKSTAILQYILIYLMLLIPGSCYFAKYLDDNTLSFFVIALCFALFALFPKYRKPYAIVFTAFMLFVVIFTRVYTNGGAGIASFLQFAVCLLSTHMAICCDIENFFTRWIKVVVALALISIVCWAVLFVMPELAGTLLGDKYYIITLGESQWATVYHARGKFFYCFLETHPHRNCGIYTEPGVYQIVLNSALFVLLFLKDKLELKNFKQYRNYIIVIIIALVTCQSTTGYIGLILTVLFFYLFRSNTAKTDSKIKRYILITFAVAIVVLILDYSSRGTESILYEQIINKLFGGSISGGFDITESTGNARLGTIIISLKAILRDPLGVGTDVFYMMKNTYDTHLVAASVMSFAAIYGLIPWIIMLISVLKPVFKKLKFSHAFLFTLLFFNTTLAQTDLLYPALIMIPMYLVYERKKKNRYLFGEL